MEKPKLSDKLLHYHAEAEEDLKLSELNIKEKSLASSGLKIKWLKTLFAERKNLSALRALKIQRTEEYVKNHGVPGGNRLQTKLEAEATAEIKKITETISEYEEIVDYLENVLKIFMVWGYDIKNAVNILDIENS